MRKLIKAGLLMSPVLFLTACHQSQVAENVPVKVASLKPSIAGCPSDSTITDIVHRFTPPNASVKVLEDKPLKEISGLCQVVVKINNAPPTVVYMSSDGKYMIPGQLIDTTTKENLTQKTLQKFMVVSKSEMKNLDQYVAFSYYKGKSYFGTNPPQAKKYVYLVTDPRCPFCHEAEPIIQKWADKHSVEVRVIYFPLPIHPGSFQYAVGLWCNKKGWNSLHEAYKAKQYMSQCDAGKQFVQKSMIEAQKLGIGGTPTLIGPNGHIHTGAPQNTETLDKWFPELVK